MSEHFGIDGFRRGDGRELELKISCEEDFRIDPDFAEDVLDWLDCSIPLIRRRLGRAIAARPHAHGVTPIVLKGVFEGERCNRDGCHGEIGLHPPENCSCHISAPCSQCTAPRHYCKACGWEEAGDE